MAIDKTPSGIYKEFQEDINYKTKMGFTSNWPENVRYKEGNQWAPPTERTKNMPRPVINQCDFICENKKSNILSQSVKIIYKPDEIPGDEELSQKVEQAATDFTDAAENTWEDVLQDDLNEDVVDDALTIGTGIWYYFLDNTIKGGMFTKYVGKLQGESLDAMDVCFGNPQLKASQTQKQPYIIIRRRTETDQLKERAKKTGEDWEKIVSDAQGKDEMYDNAKQDLDKSYKTTSYVKLYKEQGQVYWTEITESAVVQKPRTLAPEDIKREDGTIIKATPIEIYPVEVLVFKTRKKCVFGRAILDDVKANNRILNTGLGLMFLSVQQTAWPKLLAKMGALTQAVTNEPGEIITDNFGMQGVDGIKFMQPPNFSQFPMLLTDKLLDLTRQVTNTTEVNSGEIQGANMAAAAIIALQKQAQKPNEGWQTKLNRSIKNIGRIYEALHKSYYTMPRPIKGKDEDGNEITKSFTGSDYADVQFRLDVDVMQKTALDDSLTLTQLENFVAKGWVTRAQYGKYAPKNTTPQGLIREWEREDELMEQQQKTQAKADEIINSLNPEEQAYLKEHPELLDQVIQNGGMPSGNSGMPEMQGQIANI
ncbi:MAG: hypothetical protein LLG05_18705 [Porphyromonadaceae bacterium]|nr:hypothetical protein [Porphyromonadaceae bacterium]